MRISDWSSDVCSSDLQEAHHGLGIFKHQPDRVGDAHGALNKSPVRQQTPDVPKFKDQRRNKVVFLAIKLRGCRLESRAPPLLPINLVNVDRKSTRLNSSH